MAAALLPLLLATTAAGWAPLPDAELAELRGGFSLPNGIEIALTVRTDTSVNGALLLRSVFTAIGDTPALQVLAPAKGQEVPATPTSTDDTAQSVAVAGDLVVAGGAGGSGGNAVSVQFDRQNGVTFVPGPNSVVPAVNVNTGTSPEPDDSAAAGLSVVPASVGGGAVETAGGNVSLSALPDGTRIRLEGAGLDISHIVGAAFGSVIANTGSDRVIETTTTVGIDLGNAGPDVLGSAMFRVENVAVDAARIGIR